MQKSKALYVEGIIITFFVLTMILIFSTVRGWLPLVLGIGVSSVMGIIYASFMGWYASLKVEDKNIKSKNKHVHRLIIGHTIPLLITIPFFDIITGFIIVSIIAIGAAVLSSTFHNIEDSERDHIHYRIQTIIMPYIKPSIVWIMLIAATFIYGNTLRTNPNGVLIQESFIEDQAELIAPFISQILPGVNINGSVGSYFSTQASTEPINVGEQVDKLSQQLNIPLTPDTPITQALTIYGNTFLQPWMNGPIWGIIVSFMVLLTFTPFISLYKMAIQGCISYIHKQALQRNLLNLYLKNLNKERLRL